MPCGLTGRRAAAIGQAGLGAAPKLQPKTQPTQVNASFSSGFKSSDLEFRILIIPNRIDLVFVFGVEPYVSTTSPFTVLALSHWAFAFGALWPMSLSR